MTFEELKKTVSDRCGYDTSKWKESEWHRHINPADEGHSSKVGGWVQNSASVNPTAVIEESSIVMHQARVGPKAKILYGSIVDCRAEIGERVVIYDHCHITGRAKIDPGAIVGMWSTIFGDARVNFQVVLGGQTDGRDFYTRNRARVGLKGVFFTGTHAGQTDEVIRRRDIALRAYEQKVKASEKAAKSGKSIRLGHDPGGILR